MSVPLLVWSQVNEGLQYRLFCAGPLLQGHVPSSLLLRLTGYAIFNIPGTVTF